MCLRDEMFCYTDQAEGAMERAISVLFASSFLDSRDGATSRSVEAIKDRIEKRGAYVRVARTTGKMAAVSAEEDLPLTPQQREARLQAQVEVQRAENLAMLGMIHQVHCVVVELTSTESQAGYFIRAATSHGRPVLILRRKSTAYQLPPIYILEADQLVMHREYRDRVGEPGLPPDEDPYGDIVEAFDAFVEAFYARIQGFKRPKPQSA
jgi:hypothetical protein